MGTVFESKRKFPAKRPLGAEKRGIMAIYAIWNNKGGVGKSYLTFQIASEYAKKHLTRGFLSSTCVRKRLLQVCCWAVL